jgi:hypothetical protein
MKLVSIIWKKAREDAGVISAEYVAMTAVAVLLAIAITWQAFSAVMGDAITAVGEGLVEFIEESFSEA